MRDRILKGLKKKAKAIMVRRRRGDALISRPTAAKRPGRRFQ